MAETDKEFAELEKFFALARQEVDQIPPELMTRIQADADQIQAGFTEKATPVRVPRIWVQMLQVLGGWPAMGGLATACAAGVRIGLAPPSFLPDPTVFVLQEVTDLDLMDIDQLALALAEER